MTKPKEQVKPNIEEMRGIKSDKGVNWATVSPATRSARHVYDGFIAWQIFEFHLGN